MTENALQREAFDRYVAMAGRRSIERLHDELCSEDPDRWPTLRTLYEWSRRLDWQRRIAELERAATQASDDERRSAFTAMQRRHAREGLLLQQKATEFLNRIAEERVTAHAVVRMLTEGVKLERSAESTLAPVPPALEGDPLLEALTDDELAGLIQLVRADMARGQSSPS